MVSVSVGGGGGGGGVLSGLINRSHFTKVALRSSNLHGHLDPCPHHMGTWTPVPTTHS